MPSTFDSQKHSISMLFFFFYSDKKLKQNNSSQSGLFELIEPNFVFSKYLIETSRY